MARQEDKNQDKGNVGSLFVGIDIGSSFIHYAILDDEKNIRYCPKPIMHFGNPMGALIEAWGDIKNEFCGRGIVSTAFTGSGSEPFRAVMQAMTYIYDSVAIPKGAEIVAPDAKYIFHIGAKDSYFFNLNKINGKRIILEWRTGSKCGGGSGTLIEKQCRRLLHGDVPLPKLEETNGVNNKKKLKEISERNRQRQQKRLEEMMHRAVHEAKKSEEPSEFLARCGIVIQSDLIHKQNEGAQRNDNLAGLFHTVARNYRIDVLGTSELKNSEHGFAVATGGVLKNDIIRQALAELLGFSIELPEHHSNVAAIGAALKAIEDKNKFVLPLEQLREVAQRTRAKRSFVPALSDYLDDVDEKHQSIKGKIAPKTEVVLGIDGGSTTTKGALVELKTGRLLDKLYIKTHGNPEQSLKNVLKYLSKHKKNVVIRGVGATGSARKLYEKILISQKKNEELTNQGTETTDRITDEITCHALGVKHYDSEIDTIFEVGGQDMKFTSFAEDGTVKEAKMNYSCQAGSGQTLENMADVINLNVEDSLQEAALCAERVPIIDSTCGVFMEMDENRLIAEGFSREEIAAAILRGTAASYYYKFVGGSQHVGRKCSAQGGPALGKAFLAALAQVTGKKIKAYPHREMFGAWGQALDVIENIKRFEKQGKKYDSSFRGWDVIDMPFEKRKISCRQLFGDKSCGIRDCQLEVFKIEDDEIITGGFCPRGNSEAVKRPKIDYVQRYHKIYEKHFKRQGCLLSEISSAQIEGVTVGIKRSTATLGEKGIWSAALLRRLGFYPVVSPQSNKDIAKIGVDNSSTEFCIARKLATGHAAVLNENPAVEYLFNPSFIEQREQKPPDLKYCIYTESEGYILNDVLSLDKNKQINPVLHFGDVPLLVQALRDEFARLGIRFTGKSIKAAIRYADQVEQEFKEDLYREGDKFLNRIERANIKAYVGIGRDYVLLDPEASSNSGGLFSQVRGLDYIPQVFLEHRFKDIALDDIVENEFWVQSVKILKANLFVADHPNLFGIRMMNFACGPDSLKIYQEEKIHKLVNKPLLILLTDAQTNNAPFVTRTEAHERVVNQSRPRRLDIKKLKRCSSDSYDKRTWLIPYMGDASYIGAAGLKYFGIDALVLPTNTERGYELARRHIYTEVCHPLKGVVGDALGFLKENIESTSEEFVQNNYLVMLPTTSGPCRFGKYTEILREFMDREGLKKVPVVGPSSETDYLDIPFPNGFGMTDKIKMQQFLFKGINAADLLEDIYLRFRSYASDKDDLVKLKRRQLDALGRIVASGANIEEMLVWAKDTVSAFKGVKLRNQQRFPLVLYVGEIYMRQHDPYTNYVVEKLADCGLEIIRDPITDWLFYVNQVNRRNSKRDLSLGMRDFDFKRVVRQAGRFGKSLIKGKYMSSVERKIAEPFHEVLHGRHVLPKPMEIIETLEKQHECHGSIEGESPLSTGIAYYVMHDLIKPANSDGNFRNNDAYISGIFHVGPFTCMQEGVATAKIEAMAKQLRKAKPDLVFPVIHAFFGDSPNVNLDSEIAVFAEQCYQKRKILEEKCGLKASSARASDRMDIRPAPHPKRHEEYLSRAKDS
jgi:activator of 2-hydroxyglutaryl-CoA dehydratase/predicted nucleotide-binding protein (sugar kinase/HSP70/actin superfamily)